MKTLFPNKIMLMGLGLEHSILEGIIQLTTCNLNKNSPYSLWCTWHYWPFLFETSPSFLPWYLSTVLNLLYFLKWCLLFYLLVSCMVFPQFVFSFFSFIVSISMHLISTHLTIYAYVCWTLAMSRKIITAPTQEFMPKCRDTCKYASKYNTE